MKFLKYMRDGGPESKVTGFWLLEIKSLFSIALLHFENGSREAYHSHAFNSRSWVLKGKLNENMLDGTVNVYAPGLKSVRTLRTDFHKVVSEGDTWVLTFRGPWAKTWKEYIPETQRFQTLTHGRKIVG